MLEKPPQDWLGLIKKDTFTKIQANPAVEQLFDRAVKEYLYWDKFRYLPFPDEISAEEAWGYLKLTRHGGELTPVKDYARNNRLFSYNLTNSLYQRLNYIDTHGAGLLKSLAAKPSEVTSARYIINSLTDEAISSSQIEGANTTHRVAEEMILSERKPRNKSEQMIVNNYRAMQRIETWRDLKLNIEMLVELQSILTDGIEGDEEGSGRLREDEDDIVVHHPLTGEIAHIPPKKEIMLQELKRLIEYANSEDSDGNFTHPVIKATILHFWLAYLHPFVDGNGRCARAIFYWYLLKRDYWLIQYVSVSRSIKQARKGYDDAYLQTEYDDSDLTYFLLYITKAFEKSIVQFHEHLEIKMQELERTKAASQQIREFNTRQVVLLNYFVNHPDGLTDVVTHQNKHRVSRPTANNDLRELSEKDYLRTARQGRKIVYMPNMAKIRKILK